MFNMCKFLVHRKHGYLIALLPDPLYLDVERIINVFQEKSKHF